MEGRLPIEDFKDSVLEILSHYPKGLSAQEIVTKTSLIDTQVAAAIASLITDERVDGVYIPFDQPIKYKLREIVVQ